MPATPKQRDLKAFFASPGSSSSSSGKNKAQQDDGVCPATTTTTTRKRPRSPSPEWMPADERSQLKRALELSLREAGAVGEVEVGGEEQLKAETETEPHPHPHPQPQPQPQPQPHSDQTFKAEEVPGIQRASPPHQDSVPPAHQDSIHAGRPVLPTARISPPPTFHPSDFQPLSTSQRISRPDGSLSLLYLPAWLQPPARRALFDWMLAELQWHRVVYTRRDRRTGHEQKISTPRFTATFGIDDTGLPASSNVYRVRPKEIPQPLREVKLAIEALQAEEGRDDDSNTSNNTNDNSNNSNSNNSNNSNNHNHNNNSNNNNTNNNNNNTNNNNNNTSNNNTNAPAHYNALIINYYANGADSISYHSDDEAFLGPRPNIASLSLGETRDFFLRRKSTSTSNASASASAGRGVGAGVGASASAGKSTGTASDRERLTFALSSGSLLVMRGRTQAEWEHAVPKRAGGRGSGGGGAGKSKGGGLPSALQGAGGAPPRPRPRPHPPGRINITFRRALDPRAINNFTRYNRGLGPAAGASAGGGEAGAGSAPLPMAGHDSAWSGAESDETRYYRWSWAEGRMVEGGGGI